MVRRVNNEERYVVSIISVKNLTKSYKKHSVLKGICFEVEKGTVYALLGSNGAGKTTTISILSTLLAPDEGVVTVAGYDLRKQAKEIRGEISLTGQYAAIDDLLTGEENMYMMGRLSRVSETDIKQRTMTLLRQFGLEKAAKKRVSTYSGGMQRKLDLAISLLVSPSIIYLDEPTTGLDPRSRMELWRVIRELAKSGTTILLTTQYLDEADYLADRIAVLDDGKIVAEGTAEELKQQTGSDYLELCFATEDEARQARTALKRGTIPNETATTLSVVIADQSTELRQILNTLFAAHLKPGEVTIRKPTLDDVFMKLTGTSTSQKEEK